MKQQKMLIKRLLILINFLVIIFFSALFAVFSVIRSNSSFPITEKILKSKSFNNQNNFIIQTPEASYKWANKLKDDISNLSNYDEKEKISGNIKYFYKKDKPLLSNSVTVTMKTPYHDYNGASSFDSNVWNEYWKSVTDNQLKNIIINNISSNKHFISYDKTQIRFKVISRPTSSKRKESFYSDWRGTIRKRISSQKTMAIVKSVTIPYKYYFVDSSNLVAWEYLKKESENIWVKKIFMSPNDLNNTLWTKEKIKNLISFYTHTKNNYENSNDVLLSSAKVDKARRKIIVSGTIQIPGTISNPQNYWYSFNDIELPINLIDLNFLIEGSISSDSYWKHLSNGEKKYHSQKPKTFLKLSENFIKALYIFKSKDSLIKKINRDSWGFIGADKELVLSKIKSYQLNIENYENVRQSYLRSHNQSVITQLRTDHVLDKYLNLQKTANLKDYLYIFKNLNIWIKYGIKNYVNKITKLVNFLQGISLTISNQELRNLDKNRTNWAMNVKDFKIITKKKISGSLTNFLKIDLPNHYFKNYDLNLSYASESKKEVTHKYLYQKNGIDISENITFTMEDGSVLNQNFKVIRKSLESNLELNDYAYISIRYWVTFSNGKQEYLTIINKNGKWFSPKYNQEILNIDRNFNVKKLEYLFNQNLQLIINPYLTKKSTDSGAIKFFGKPKYGIKRVSDELNNKVTILEDWNDGLWSHTHKQDGTATFDGVFGADMNGIFDYRGRLKEGKHHINVELQNISFSGLRNNFYITIDKKPVSVNVKGLSYATKKINIKDDEDNNAILYFSSGPINFSAKNIDIKSIEGKFIDYQGNWYNLPIEIKSKNIDGKWKLVIDSTIDYAGFAKIKIYDQARNFKILYFWLKQNGSEIPDLNFKENILLKKIQKIYLDEPLKLLESISKVVISSPLVTNLEITKQELEQNIWKDSQDKDFSIDDYKPQNSINYDFGKPINSTRLVLKFAGDELKPFLKKQKDNKWPVLNKVINFKKPGLYKIVLWTRFIDKKTIIKYIYIKDDNLKPIDITKFLNEISNFNELPNKNQGPKINIDQNIKTRENLVINIPKFLIEEYSIKFSLLWYSEFSKIKNPSLIFKNEGKYKIYLKDIFGNEYKWNLLLLKKSLSSFVRKKENLFLIASDEKEIDKTAFWKGKVVWNYFRYEDADHAKWEHDDFIRKAIDGGLTRSQAEALYKKLKGDKNWDGILPRDVNEKSFNFGKFYQENFRSSFNPNELKSISKSNKIGIIVGSSIAGVTLTSLIGFLIIKRFKGRKIK